MGDTGGMLPIASLIDDANCGETVRILRWPDGVACPHGDSFDIPQQGRDDPQPERQRSRGESCARRLDAWTDPICTGHHPPLRVWRRWWSFLGLHLSNHPMAPARDRQKDDGQQRTGP